MKKILTISFLSIAVSTLFAARPDQAAYSPEQLAGICDSIVAEGNLLYRYERAAWLATDMALENSTIADDMAGYLVYEHGDSMKIVILGRELECIMEISFRGPQVDVGKVAYGPRDLLPQEELLFDTRENILDQIIEKNETYGVAFYEGFSPNFVLIPQQNGYRFYVLTGTAQHGVIPFGNDHVFFTDTEGNITHWRKLHSGLIAISMDDTVRQTVHSHRADEPFITPTDICTFMLYGPMYGQKDFKVFSPALGIYMTYDADSNSVTFSDAGRGEAPKKKKKRM